MMAPRKTRPPGSLPPDDPDPAVTEARPPVADIRDLNDEEKARRLEKCQQLLTQIKELKLEKKKASEEAKAAGNKIKSYQSEIESLIGAKPSPQMRIPDGTAH